MDMLSTIVNGIVVIADAFTIVASGIAIFIFFTKRRAISSVFNLLLKYGYQITLSELRSKLDRIAELRVASGGQNQEVINTLSEIVGQIRG